MRDPAGDASRDDPTPGDPTLSDTPNGALNGAHDGASDGTTRRIRLRAAAIVASGVALVAVAAVVLEPRLNDDGDRGTLAAPQTPLDDDRAELARRIRDAVVTVDADPAAPKGGAWASGRGWVFGAGNGDVDHALLPSLRPALGDRIADLTAALDADDDVLVHACGSAFGVFVRSSTTIAEADARWWQEQECSPVPRWLVDQPVFFVVGGTDAG